MSTNPRKVLFSSFHKAQPPRSIVGQTPKIEKGEMALVYDGESTSWGGVVNTRHRLQKSAHQRGERSLTLIAGSLPLRGVLPLPHRHRP